MDAMSSDKLNVFVSYSHDDDPRWLERVQVHLKPLARDDRLDLWDDTRIKGGDRWRQEISDALDRAKVAVLLVSADFYASDFIAKNELPPLLEAARERGLKILGVHINYSRFDRDQVLSEYQTINPPDEPIEDLPSRGKQEKVFAGLARRIEELLEPPNPCSIPGQREINCRVAVRARRHPLVMDAHLHFRITRRAKEQRPRMRDAANGAYDCTWENGRSRLRDRPPRIEVAVSAKPVL